MGELQVSGPGFADGVDQCARIAVAPISTTRNTKQLPMLAPER